MSQRSAGLTRNSWGWSRRRRSCSRRLTSSSTSSLPLLSSPSWSSSYFSSSSSSCTAWSCTSWGRGASRDCWRSRRPAVAEEKRVLNIAGKQRMILNKQISAPALPCQVATNLMKPNQSGRKPRQDKNMFSCCAKSNIKLMRQNTHPFLTWISWRMASWWIPHLSFHDIDQWPPILLFLTLNVFWKIAFPVFPTNYLKAFEREGSMQSINKADSSQGYHILANIKQHLYQSWSPNFRDDHYHHVPQYFFRSFFLSWKILWCTLVNGGRQLEVAKFTENIKYRPEYYDALWISGRLLIELIQTLSRYSNMHGNYLGEYWLDN